MQPCKKAADETKSTVLAVILVAAYDSWRCNDFTLSSIAKRSYDLGKLTLKDKEIRANFSTWLGCKLRKYLKF